MSTAQDQQSRELLPCPFCGSPNVTLEHIQSSAYEAFCEFCGASGPCDSEQWRAAKGWNARAMPAVSVPSTNITILTATRLKETHDLRRSKKPREVRSVAQAPVPLAQEASRKS
ncbi:Lar family restriction alleviation protein [Comamonas sp.]|uniref:Lar family restriction alleviation protein n=1 Tax=Comamonas sp. TaxID=34028 RepID=UPI003FA525B4